MPSLFVIKGRDQGKIFELEPGVSALGRDSHNSIQLHDSEVSRRHAEIRISSDRIVITDHGSSNGTFINSQRTEQHELATGDQIQIGRTVMLFTGPKDPSENDLVNRVDIVTPSALSDQSEIIHSVRPEDGSEIFSHSQDTAESPWLARARSNLQVMYRTALAVSHTLDIDQLLKRIMELIFEWVETHRGCIMIIDQETKQPVPRVFRNRRGDSDEKISISRTILDYVMERNEGVLTSNAPDDMRFDAANSILQSEVREAICVPMQGRYDVVGVIYIDTTTAPQHVIQRGRQAKKFTEDHLKLMVAIGHQAALAIEDTSYYSAMVQAERLAAIGQTIATLSHHTKNILQGINGGSYLIEEGLKSNENDVIRKGWEIVRKNQEKISNLVMDMLTFSKERDPDLTPSDLNQVTDDVVELMQGHATAMGVELHWTPDQSLPIMQFDPDGLHRAILNLVTNAIDACDVAENARVDVSTEYDEEAGLLKVIVKDNGTGIDPKEIEEMFSIFVSKKGGRGTGLGLPVTQKILTEHGGQVHVESELEKGSCFILELPAITPEIAVPEAESNRDTLQEDPYTKKESSDSASNS